MFRRLLTVICGKWPRARGKHNKRMSRRNCQSQYLLRGLVKCGCGASMTAAQSAKKYFYYRCTHRDADRFSGLRGKALHRETSPRDFSSRRSCGITCIA